MFCFSKGAAANIVGFGAVGNAPNDGVADVVCPRLEPLVGYELSTIGGTEEPTPVVDAVAVGVATGVAAVVVG